MPEIETNVDDLTDAGCASILFDLMGTAHPIDDYGCEWNRRVLRRWAIALDRASPDWPTRVLGLPAVA